MNRQALAAALGAAMAALLSEWHFLNLQRRIV